MNLRLAMTAGDGTESPARRTFQTRSPVDWVWDGQFFLYENNVPETSEVNEPPPKRDTSGQPAAQIDKSTPGSIAHTDRKGKIGRKHVHYIIASAQTTKHLTNSYQTTCQLLSVIKSLGISSTVPYHI
jgi:hypothetical protein